VLIAMLGYGIATGRFAATEDEETLCGYKGTAEYDDFMARCYASANLNVSCRSRAFGYFCGAKGDK
jgi:hypothetical protein